MSCNIFQMLPTPRNKYYYFFTQYSTHLLTYSLHRAEPSWEPNQFSASQEIPCNLWNPKVHYLIHLSLSWVPSMQSMPSHPTSWISIYILPSHLCLGLPGGLFPWVSPQKPCIHLSLLSATWPAHLILLYLITWTRLHEMHRSLSTSLCSFLHSHVTSFLLSPIILLSTILSKTLSLCSSLIVTD